MADKTGIIEGFHAAAAHGDLAALVDDPRPALAFDRSGTRVIWANAAGAALVGARTLGALLDRRLPAAGATARRLATIAGQVGAAPRIERVPLPTGPVPVFAVCSVRRLILDAERALLLLVDDGTGKLASPDAARAAYAALLDTGRPTSPSVAEEVPASRAEPPAATEPADAAADAEPAVDDGAAVSGEAAVERAAAASDETPTVAVEDPSTVPEPSATESTETAAPAGDTIATVGDGIAVPAEPTMPDLAPAAEPADVARDALPPASGDSATEEPPVAVPLQDEPDADAVGGNEPSSATDTAGATDRPDARGARTDSDDRSEAAEVYAGDADGRTGQATASPSADPEVPGEPAAVAAEPRFVFPADNRMVRFVFELDPDLRFQFVSADLADTVGPDAAAPVGASWQDVADDRALDPAGRVQAALARKDTFTGLTVDWPVQDSDLRVPVDLAGMPVFGRDRSFRGYRGFGVVKTGAAFRAAPTPATVIVFAPVPRPDFADKQPADPAESAEEAPALVDDTKPVTVGPDGVSQPDTGGEAMAELGLGSAWSPVEPDIGDAGPEGTNDGPSDAAALAPADAGDADRTFPGDGETLPDRSDDPDEAQLSEAEAPAIVVDEEPTVIVDGAVESALAEEPAGAENGSDEVDVAVTPADRPEDETAGDAEFVRDETDERAERQPDELDADIADAASDPQEPQEPTAWMPDGAAEPAGEPASGAAEFLAEPRQDHLGADHAEPEFALVESEVDAVPPPADALAEPQGDAATVPVGSASDDLDTTAGSADGAEFAAASIDDDGAVESDLSARPFETGDDLPGGETERGLQGDPADQVSDSAENVESATAVAPAPDGVGAAGLTDDADDAEGVDVPAPEPAAWDLGSTPDALPTVHETGPTDGASEVTVDEPFADRDETVGINGAVEPVEGTPADAAPDGIPATDSGPADPRAGDEVPETVDLSAGSSPDAGVVDPEGTAEPDHTAGTDKIPAADEARDAEGEAGVAAADGIVGPPDAATDGDSAAMDDHRDGMDGDPDGDAQAAFMAGTDQPADDVMPEADEAVSPGPGVLADPTDDSRSAEVTLVDGTTGRSGDESVLDWRERSTTAEVIPSPIVPRSVPPQSYTPEEASRRQLSKPERDAFQKIAEALGARVEGDFDPLPPAIETPAAQPRVSDAAHETIELAVLDKIPVALAVLKDGEAVTVNRAFLDLAGYASLADVERAGGFSEVFSGSPLPRDNSLPAVRRSDGVELPVRAMLHSIPWGEGVAALLTLQETATATGRDRAEAAESRVDMLEAILDTATDGVLVLDSKGVVTGANRSAEALFGAERSTMVGEPLVALLAPESHRAALDYLDGLARNGVASVLNDGREVIGRVPQGGLVPLFMTVGRISAGTFCAVLRDITSWKRAEEELVAARRAAENASSQKSEFLAKISHEIRTPLNAIIGFSEVMMEERFGPVGSDRYKEYLRDIHLSGAHIMSLVNDLLDLSKIEAGKLELSFEAVPANDVIRECVALMQPQANRERIIIRTSLSSTLPNVVADSRSLRQIVLNLLSNAIKFNSTGGQVIVSTIYEDTGEVAIRVRDTGPGMSGEDIEKALEPFRQLQTARPGRGTGLGLPLTKALVEANRASFRIDSTVGQGTLVQVTFPSTRVLAE